ncbi:MAG: RNA polymerase sigma factor [bacterium]
MNTKDSNLSEEELAKKAQSGDTDALSVLFDLHYEKLYRYLYSRLGSREEAEDVLQETFIKVMKSIKRFEFRSSFKTWLYHIAYVTVMDSWRWHYKKGSLPLLEFCAGEDPKNFEDEAEIEAELNMKEAKVKKLLKILPDKYKQVLELRFLKGYSTAEIAEEMSITVNNVKVRQYRALQKVRDKFTSNEE